jgi:signal transduction histidine kinase
MLWTWLWKMEAPPESPVQRPGLAIVVTGPVFGLVATTSVVVLRSGGELDLDVLLGLVVVAMIAGIMLARRPHHPISWVLSGTAISGAVAAVSAAALPGEVSDAPRWQVVLGVMDGPARIVFLFTLLCLVPLLFPTGAPPSPHWRWVAWVGISDTVVLSFLFMFQEELCTDISDGTCLVPIDNPIGIPGLPDPEFVLGGAFFGVFAVTTLAAAVSVVVRFARSRGVERQQLKWFTLNIPLFVLTVLTGEFLWVDLLGNPEPPFILRADLLFLSIPATIALAILRYRLYDIDLVISRTFVYGALAVFIAGVYVAIVVGVGGLLGTGDEPNRVLSIAATALVAIAFQPVRRWLQQLANRLVYGRRATPYQVLSEFSRRLSATDEHVIDQVARSLADGTSAQSAAVWVRSGDRFQRSTVWPEDSLHPEPVSADTDQIPGADRTAWVMHDGERLGALALTFPRGQQPTPLDERLLSEVAAGLGLALRNSLLVADLRRRVEELRESRRRIVAAQDGTRRQLERDLHDGAQQQLVALKVKLALARRLAASSGAQQASEVLEGLNTEAESAIQAMRDLARGIYPPLLEAEGLGPALAALARKAPLPVSLEAPGIGRYPRQIESTVYFCIVEALQNTARHARAHSAHIRLGEEGGELVFSVRDDGTGFDPTATSPGNGLVNLAERIDALEGRLEIRSAPGEGTTITGSLPVEALVPA